MNTGGYDAKVLGYFIAEIVSIGLSDYLHVSHNTIWPLVATVDIMSIVFSTAVVIYVVRYLIWRFKHPLD